MAVTKRGFLTAAAAGIVSAGAGVLAGGYLFSGGRRLVPSDVSRSLYVPTDPAIPREADVVVIGGGIAGISTALALKDRGMDVVVCEKGYVAGEQSSRAYGWITSNGWHPQKVPMANRGKSLWQGMATRLGADVGYRQTGNMSLFSSDEEIASAEAWIKEARAASPYVDAQIVTGTALDALLPHGRGRYKAALYQASDGMIEPGYSPALVAEGAQRAGVKIVAPCAVRSLETTGGAISHVMTEHGPIKTKCAVLAGGAWSSLFCGNAGIYLPLLATVNSSLQRVSVTDGPPGCGIGADYSWRRRADGDYIILAPHFYSLITRDSFRMLFDFLPMLKHTSLPVHLRFDGDFFDSLHVPRKWRADEISPFERARVLGARFDERLLQDVLKRIAVDFPAFAQASVKDRWGGLIDATPDATPVISAVPRIPGLMLCTGFSGAGLTMGPAGGEMLAQMIAGEKTLLDPAIYRFTRFADDSKLTLRE